MRTKQQILDAAEQCFAEQGFEGVSMRLVADRAAVLLGLLTYHFATKESLFAAVIARRADELNANRLAAMTLVAPDDLVGLLEAFIHPYLDLLETGEPGWRAYAHVIAVTAQNSRWSALGEQYFGAVGRLFISRLQVAVPGLDEDLAVRAYVHTVSIIMGLFAASGLIDRFSGGRLDSNDLRSGYAPALRFLAGGIRSLADASALRTD
ncbi:TetR/AcrR family transcriptional regulator [Sphingomonas sp.]|uniref:TetR/AcrR family transcriptional regulator n=1 Tax=Sphingomonas sp. TaxID=28214 RepID=UPI003BACE29E